MRDSAAMDRRALLRAGMFAGLSAGVNSAFGQASTPEQAKPASPSGPVSVVELFTSQGCSSCPPADALLLELSADPSTIALTFAVEIWDYLGWKDTLAKPGFTKRQRLYANSLAKRQAYTPQAVINGRAHCVGSDRAALSRLRQNAGAMARARFTLDEDKTGFRASLALNAPHHLVLASISTRKEVMIERGENRGRTLTYANVVRDLQAIGSLDQPVISRAELAARGCDGFALLAQAGSLDAPGEIFAAAFFGPAGLRV
jgi:hypothetical protein